VILYFVLCFHVIFALSVFLLGRFAVEFVDCYLLIYLFAIYYSCAVLNMYLFRACTDVLRAETRCNKFMN